MSEINWSRCSIKRLDRSSFFGKEAFSTYPTRCFKEIRVTPKIRVVTKLCSKLWTLKIRHCKSILLSTKLVDGRACWPHLRRSTRRQRNRLGKKMRLACSDSCDLSCLLDDVFRFLALWWENDALMPTTDCGRNPSPFTARHTRSWTTSVTNYHLRLPTSRVNNGSHAVTHAWPMTHQINNATTHFIKTIKMLNTQ